MKKIMNIFVLVAAAAMTLVSCQKNEMDAPAAKKELHFTIKANAPQTKTVISDNGDKTYTPSWEKGDEIGIFFSEPTEETESLAYSFKNISEDGPIAEFDGKAPASAEGVFYSFYPSSSFGKAYGDGTIGMDLSNFQKPTSTSFDPACDILVAQPCEYLSDGETVVIDDLHFARIMSVLRINLNSTFADVKDEVVESVSFAVQDIDMAGNAKVDYKTGEIVGWNNGSVARNVITASYTGEEFVTVAGENNSVYLVVAPVQIPAGKEITFTIETQNYTITKTVAAPAMEFNAGKVEVINLTILAENCEKEDTSLDYSGEYLITGLKSGSMYAAQKWVSGNNNLKTLALTLSGDNVLEVDGIADCKMTVTKVTSGDYEGMYTIEDASSTTEKRSYLYAAGTNTQNYLKASSELAAGSYWDIALNDDGTYTIVAAKHGSERNTIWFNSGSSLFSCYQLTSTSYAAVTLYPYSMVVPDTTPKINVSSDLEQTVGADGGEVKIEYTLKNLDGMTLTVEENSDFVSASVAAGVVTVTVDANEATESRSATLTLKCGEAAPVSVTVNQAGKQAAGGELKTWSWTGGGKTAFENDSNVYKTNSLGSDYAAGNAPYLIKLDGTGDYFIIQVDGAIQSVSIDVKMLGGPNTSTLDIQGSADGTTFTSVEKLSILGAQNAILNLSTTKSFDSSYRYVKFYFTKGSNVGVGPMSITYMSGSTGDEPTDPTPDPDEPGTIYQFTSNDITPGGSKNTGTINGLLGYKLGSSSAAGTLNFPAGYSEITFYAVGWSSGTNNITLTNGTVNGSNSLTLTNNSVAANNFTDGFSKTLTNQDAYKYTIVVANPSQSVELSLKRGLVWGFEGVPAN